MRIEKSKTLEANYDNKYRGIMFKKALKSFGSEVFFSTDKLELLTQKLNC